MVGRSASWAWLKPSEANLCHMKVSEANLKWVMQLLVCNFTSLWVKPAKGDGCQLLWSDASCWWVMPVAFGDTSCWWVIPDAGQWYQLIWKAVTCWSMLLAFGEWQPAAGISYQLLMSDVRCCSVISAAVIPAINEWCKHCMEQDKSFFAQNYNVYHTKENVFTKNLLSCGSLQWGTVQICNANI